MPFDGETWTRTQQRLAILRFAREGLARDGGWCQHELTKGHSHCALGWLSAARRSLGAPPGWKGGADFADRFIPIDRVENLMDFNDDYHTVQADVVAVFDRAIALMEVSDAV